MRIVTVLLTALLTTGCATSGLKISQAQMDKIVAGQTTRDEMISIFGPPTSETVGADGNKILAWGYARVDFLITTDKQGMAVFLGPDGTVSSYNRQGSTPPASKVKQAVPPSALHQSPAKIPVERQPETKRIMPSTPMCYSNDQCDAMWAEAMIQIQALSQMRIKIATENFAQTYNPTTSGRMGASIQKIPAPDGATATQAEFSCTNTCNDQITSALNIFNKSISQTGAAFKNQ
ncbi:MULTISPECIES: hypothetical protein [unclassified Pseudomonas]|uniref:hypothetical protein n=1 Tax=unclassified Pseudomonas TaxID=196821 RepID=UPI0024472611|nr:MULTISPECIES: hypothetical protein [unclassified Pseudomonas]MDH0892747.1 hypothetical protein [Pseudomonas sp. GD03875]MDH1063593.1 hypothetical protein [Pseudomonas sp. GD03985]